MSLTITQVDRATLQRKVIRTLVATQILGGVGMASGIAVGALLAEEISGTEALAGVGTTSQVLGSALITIPVARVIAGHGRRMGQSLGLSVAFVGAAVVITAAVAGSFPLFLVGMFLFGGGTTANNQARCCGRSRRAGPSWSRPLDRRLGHRSARWPGRTSSARGSRPPA